MDETNIVQMSLDYDIDLIKLKKIFVNNSVNLFELIKACGKFPKINNYLEEYLKTYTDFATVNWFNNTIKIH